MSGLDITIELPGALDALLIRAIREGEDLTQPMADISDEMVAGSMRNFEEERGPDGVPWKKSQRVLEDGGKTLTLGRFLRSAVVPNYGRDFAEAGVLKTAGPAVYARIHQMGGPIASRGNAEKAFVSRLIMPARPYLGFDDETRGHVIDILTEHLRALFSSDGLGSGGS